MTLIRLKTRHFRTKKMYDADTKSLIFQGYGCRLWLSNLTMSFYIKQF